MRMNTIAGGHEALVIVLPNVALQHLVFNIRRPRVIMDTVFGLVQQTRTFLALRDENSTTSKRGLNSRRQKCDLIYIDSIPCPENSRKLVCLGHCIGHSEP